MKIYTYYTESHKPFYDNYFSKTIEDLEVVGISGDQECPTGSYYQDGWKKTTMKKVDVFIQACVENQGKTFVYSDVDIQFFGPLKQTLIYELSDFDIAIQNDYLGGMCSGFFVCKGNERTLKMFQSMKDNESSYLEDQHALNMNLHHVKFKPLSSRFWTFGMYQTQWKNQNFDIPEDILMHHANWTEGIQNKTNLLNFVRQKHNLKKLVKDNSQNYQSFLFDYFKEFRPNPEYPVYPPYHQGKYLEDFFIDFYRNQNSDSETFFIPISWTTCYIQNTNLGLLQEKLLSLDKTRKYFTVSQHDDAIREHMPPNTTNYCAGGNGGGISIPLVCSRIPTELITKFNKKDRDIFCSFIGSVTHPLRQKMISILEKDSNYYLKYGAWNNNLKMNDFEHFAEISSRSKFTLCPRGYGKSSFRMYESIQFGSIPVYIYDDDWRPFKELVDWESFSISIHESQINNIKSVLESVSEEKYKQMSDNLIQVYNEYFSLESVCKIILNKI